MTAIVAKSSNLFSGVGSPFGTKTSSLSGISRNITVYKLPDESSDKLRQEVMLALTLCGRSSDPSVSHWQTFALTYCVVGFPGLAAMIKGEVSRDYKVVDFPEQFLTDVITIGQTFDNDINADDQTLIFPPGLPLTTTQYSGDLYEAYSLGGVYTYLALVVFLAGKRISPDNRDSIIKNRPTAQIKKYGLSVAEYYLTGPGRISDHGHGCINNAWVQSSAPRRIIVREFSRFAGTDDYTQEVVYTMFRLLEYAGIQSAFFIHQLLLACPWIYEIPALKPGLDLYERSLEQMAREDPIIRPYVKVMYGDSTKLFHTKTMAGLIACAVIWVQQSSPSIAQYGTSGGDFERQVFLAELDKRGIQLGAPATLGAVPTATPDV